MTKFDRFEQQEQVLKTTALFLLATTVAMAFPGGHADADPTLADIFSIPLQTIDGQSSWFGIYEGRVVMVVNTASQCGHTPQYEDLQTLYRMYRSRGFAVAAFPSNDFGGQEPDSNQTIADNLAREYGIQFDVYAKTPVVGPDAHLLFRHLEQQMDHRPAWNFHKVLVGRDGRVIQTFNPATNPLDAAVSSAVEAALSEPARKESTK